MRRVLFHDRFELPQATTAWFKTSGTGTVGLTSATDEWLSGGQALKITTSLVADQALEIHRYVGRPAGMPIVMFGMIFALLDENASYLDMYCGWRDPSVWYRGRIGHSYSTNAWRYDAAGASPVNNTVTLMTRDFAENIRPRWRTMTVAVDFAGLVYKTITVDEQDFTSTVNNVTCRQTADTTTTNDDNVLDLAWEIGNTSSPGANAVILIDEAWAIAYDLNAWNSGIGRYPDPLAYLVPAEPA